MTRYGLKIGGWLSKGEPRKTDIALGAVFRKVRPDNFIETAKVLALTADRFGIPHVRFDVSFESPSHRRQAEGVRMLSVETFTEHFPELVSA